MPCMFLKAAGGDILPPLCLGQAKRRDNCVPWCTRKHLHQFANDYSHGLSFLPRKITCSQQWLLMDPFPLSIYLLSPAIKTALPSLPLKHEPKCHVSTSFKYIWGWWLNCFSEQPMPMLYSSFPEEIFPNIQSNLGVSG